MPFIIATTDFSEIAANAVHYACNMAIDQRADVVLLHAYSIPIMFSDMPLPAPLAETEQVVQQTMNTFAGKIRGLFPDVSITTAVIYGNVLDGIEDYSEKNGEPLLVIAGNGYSAENPAWMDSALMQAVKHMKYPLLAVPAGAAYQPVNNICFAYDNKYAGSDVALLKIRELAKNLGARLMVLLAATDATKITDLESINEQARNVLEPANPEYFVIHGTHVNDAIQDYLSQYDADWLAMIPRKHSLIDGLFHKSHTKFMVSNTHLPLLALHES